MSQRSHLALAAAFWLAACQSSGDGGDGGTGGTAVIGKPIDREHCERDDDCPLGYVCLATQCQVAAPDDDGDGFTTVADCDDTDVDVHPEATEICNERDDDCDALQDEGVTNACGECGPDPEELCDLLDNDCDGTIDDGCLGGASFEREPNNGGGQCQAIAVPQAFADEVQLTGRFEPAGDVDSFCFEVTPGVALTFDIDSALLGAPTDARITLYDHTTHLALPGGENDYANGPDPFLAYSFSLDGPVRLDVSNTEVLGGPTFIYVLRITASSPPGACDDQDGDLVSPCAGDCNDNDPLVFPAQTEVCDQIDNDCDAQIDDVCPPDTVLEREPNNLLSTCMPIAVPSTLAGVIGAPGDEDTFCFFAPKGARIGFDIDAREPPQLSTLNARLSLWPMTGVALAVNLDGPDPQTGYTEVDSDSYLEHTFFLAGQYAIRVQDESAAAGGLAATYLLDIVLAEPAVCVDADGDGVTTCEGDCDDTNVTVYYGAIEICDPLRRDHDCRGDGDPVSCTGDTDGDGVAGAAGDCDDHNPFILPGALEICDERDNDCDTQIDENVRNACGGCGYPPPELCANDLDDDCDGDTDLDCDTDHDGDLVTPDAGDCDDERADVHPLAVESCDLVDNDCDGLVDEDVRNGCGTCEPPREELVEICNGVDDDCNGYTDEDVLNTCGFCGAPPAEICDGADNDCNALIDEGLTNACGTCGPLPKEACDLDDNDCNGIVDDECDSDKDSDGVTPREGDCDDDDATTYAGAPELCDDLDNDCNAFIDDDELACGPWTETETNNTQATCNPIVWPIVLHGVVSDLADRDHFCFSVPPDTVLGFDVDAGSLNSPLDSRLDLYAADGTLLDSNTNAAAPGDPSPNTADSYLVATFEDGGDFVVRVSPEAIAGANPFYELTILPAGGCNDLDRDGVFDCDGDCDDFDAARGPGVVDTCDGVDNNCDGDVDERCINGCLDDLRENNDTVFTATPLAAGLHGGLQLCGGDPDYYAIEVTTPGDLLFDLDFGLGVVVTVQVTLYDTDAFTVLAMSAPDIPTVTATLTTPGVYFVGITAPLAVEQPYDALVVVPQ